jgi:DNA-binding PadR family transcriptional regulator
MPIPAVGGRPPRKYYQLTAEGARVARLELARASLPAPRGTRGSARPDPARRPNPGRAQ